MWHTVLNRPGDYRVIIKFNKMVYSTTSINANIELVYREKSDDQILVGDWQE